MNSLLYLNKYLVRYKWRLILGLVFISFNNIFNIFIPQVVRYTIDTVKESIGSYFLMHQEAFDSFSSDLALTTGKLALFAGGTIIILAILKGIFLFLTRQTIIIVSRLIEYDLKNEIFDQYQVLSLAFYKRNKTGDLMNRISEDVSKVRMYLGPAIMYSANLTLLFILVISTMLKVNTELTLYVLLPLPLLSFLIYYVSNIINKKSDKVQRQLSTLSSYSQEAYSGIRVLKAYNRELTSLSSFQDECEEYKNLNLDLVKVNALFHPIMLLLIGISTTLTIYIGGILAMQGKVTIGNIAEFVIYVNMLTWPIAAVGWVTSLVQRAAASQTRINEFLQIEPEISNLNASKSEIGGNIDFKNVTFEYPDSGIRALNNVSFSVKKGQTLAILGKTGSGKSTIANLISRLYDIKEGEILIDKIPLRNTNLNDLRSNIGYVPQEVFLFSETIEKNISFGIKNREASLESVKQAAKDAAIYSNIENFPEKFDTYVGERGITLSGGQKQRISIARAIIRHPQILIFDDCLSAVDTETEEEILTNLKRIMSDKTSIIISHRISSIKHADHIIILEDGEIIEEGNHTKLIDQKGTYFDLFQKQQMDIE
ncbi:ABC transporter ATP-binding protein/permease [Flavobacteriales bacterium]|nr:ABC transporter ATP-binding protein/permease [Flavobacteriales bacterium]